MLAKGPPARNGRPHLFRSASCSNSLRELLHRLEAGAGALDARPGLGLQAVKVDEAAGGGVVEGVALVVGGQVVVVEAVVGAQAVDEEAALAQDDADVTGNVLLRVGVEGIDGVAVQGEPQATVDGGGPLDVELGLLLQGLGVKAELLEGLVGLDEQQGGGALIALAGS